MLLLAMDTSTSAVTVALHDSGPIAWHEVCDPRAHAEHLAPGVRRVLQEAGVRPAEVTHVVAGTGPGPFTGLRVGIVTAETFALACGAQVGGVCSLDALAHQGWRADPEASAEGLVVATDARRKEVYWGRYEMSGQGPVRVGGPRVSRPADLDPGVRSLPVVGRGAQLYPEAFGRPLGPLDVDARALAAVAAARLEAGGHLDDTRPHYLRRPDAVPSAGPKSVLSGRA